MRQIHELAKLMAVHRLSEAAMLLDLAADGLAELVRKAGPLNGLMAQCDGMSRDIMTLAARARAAADRAHRPEPSAEITTEVNHDHLLAVLTARNQEEG